MGCSCGCGSPGACRAFENSRALLETTRQLVRTGAIAERDALRAVTDAMTAFSDAAQPAALHARAFADSMRAIAEVTYHIGYMEPEPMGYNARPLTEAFRAAMPRMIDSMTGTTQSENITPSEPLTIDTIRRAHARILGEGLTVPNSESVVIGDIVMDGSHAIGVVESLNPDGSANVRFTGAAAVQTVAHHHHLFADRTTPTPALEPKKLPVRKIVTD